MSGELVTDLAIRKYPPSWKVMTLGELCKEGDGDIQTGPFGSQLHASDYVDFGIPSIMPKNISPEGISTDDIAYITEEDAARLSRYRVRKGDIIYSRRGDVEKCALVTERESGWLCGTGCLRVRLGQQSQVTSVFLHAYLSHPSVREWIVRHAVGATMPNLNTSILSSLPVLLPSLAQKSAIESNWIAFNHKLNLNRQINATLEHLSQAIFKSWFVDFDPVKAKQASLAAGNTAEDANRAAMRVISGKTDAQLSELQSQNPAAYDQLATTAALFPAAMQDSELGEIPEGWTVKPLFDMIQLISGGTPKRSEPSFWKGTIPWFSVKDTPSEGDVFAIDTEEKITHVGLERSPTKLLPFGTAIITARGTVGKLALTGVPMAMNQSCYGVRGRIDEGIYFNFFRLAHAVRTLKHHTHGAVFDTITKNTFKTVQFVDVSHEVVLRYEEAVAPIMKRIRECLFISQTLAALRDALLPKLLSGELQLPEDEA